MKQSTASLFLHALVALLCANLAAPASAVPAPDIAPGSTREQTHNAYIYPKSTHLQYDIRGESKGFPYSANAELQWLNKGNTYEVQMEISHFLLGSKVQTSSGQLTPRGLEPARYTSRFRGEDVANFERTKNLVTFSAKTPDAPLQPGTQDRVSLYLQLAALLAGAPGKLAVGSKLPFQMVGERTVESWVFTVGVTEKLSLPGGEVSAIRLWQDPVNENDTKGEIWLAPSMDYLPVRIRVSQSSGDFVDQRWRATLKPQGNAGR